MIKLNETYVVTYSGKLITVIEDNTDVGIVTVKDTDGLEFWVHVSDLSPQELF